MQRNYSNFITEYLSYSKYSEAPEMMHTWTAISIIAGALQGKVCIHQGYFIWPANFYIVFVAPPGIVSKSTTMNIGMDLLKAVPGIHFGPEVVTWQALAPALVNCAEEYEVEGEFETTSSLTIASSEFGMFLDPQDRAMVNFLIHLWDGQKRETEKATKTMGSDYIKSPWLNIIACTTPSWIADNFTEYFIGGGFVSRCIFIYAEAKRHLVAYPGSVIPEGFLETRSKLIADLEKISAMKGQFIIDTHALAWGTAWYELHNEKYLSSSKTDPRLRNYYARKQTHLHKIAMVLSAAENDSMIITEQHLQRANELLIVAEKNMLQVYNQVGSKEETRAAGELIQQARRQGSILLQDAYRRFSRYLTATQFEEAIKSAQKTGDLEVVNTAKGYILRYTGSP